MSQTRHVWVRDLLALLKAPGTLENALAIVAQIQAEGGAAKFNPLNCTVRAPGSTDYNKVPVQNYVTYAQGLHVTAGMLQQTNMRGLHAELMKGDSSAIYWSALAVSPWGTHPPERSPGVPYTVAQWLADVRAHWFDRAMLPISGT